MVPPDGFLANAARHFRAPCLDDVISNSPFPWPQTEPSHPGYLVTARQITNFATSMGTFAT
jgi:hypothetical protein